MRVQRGYRSPRNYRRSPRYQSPRNRSPKANHVRQQNPSIINKIIELHNRIQGLTSELSQKTKRENDILGKIEHIIQMIKRQELKSLKLIESINHHQEQQLGEMAVLKTRLDNQEQQLGEMAVLKTRLDNQEQQLGEMAVLKTRLDNHQQQLDTVSLGSNVQTTEIINCKTKITNIIETTLTFLANKLDKNILHLITLEDKMNKALEEKTTAPEPTPATKDEEEKTIAQEPTTTSLSKKPKKRSIKISLDDE